MQFHHSPTELTTAFTDLLLSVVSFGLSFVLVGLGRRTDLRKATVWAAALGLMGLASGIGFFVHGFLWSEATHKLLWQPLFLSLGLTLSMFVVGVVYDLRGYSLPRYFLFGMLLLGVAFYGITLVFPGTFLVFTAYEGVAMLFSFGAYTYLATARKFPGSTLMATGIAVTILAAAIQATKMIHFHLIWEFDHNGAFHLVQIAGAILLYLGVRKELTVRWQRLAKQGLVREKS